MKTLLLLALVALCGCTSNSAYQSISATETALLNGNAAYLDLVVSGKTPTNNVPTVEAAFNDTQLALHAAAVISAAGTNGPVTADAAAKATNFTNIVNSATGKKTL